jgi:hypothetical protein
VDAGGDEVGLELARWVALDDRVVALGPCGEDRARLHPSGLDRVERDHERLRVVDEIVVDDDGDARVNRPVDRALGLLREPTVGAEHDPDDDDVRTLRNELVDLRHLSFNARLGVDELVRAPGSVNLLLDRRLVPQRDPIFRVVVPRLADEAARRGADCAAGRESATRGGRRGAGRRRRAGRAHQAGDNADSDEPSPLHRRISCTPCRPPRSYLPAHRRHLHRRIDPRRSHRKVGRLR